jgi:hypothetical protein
MILPNSALQWRGKIPFRGAQHRVSLINFQYLSFQLVLGKPRTKTSKACNERHCKDYDDNKLFEVVMKTGKKNLETENLLILKFQSTKHSSYIQEANSKKKGRK